MQPLQYGMHRNPPCSPAAPQHNHHHHPHQWRLSTTPSQPTPQQLFTHAFTTLVSFHTVPSQLSLSLQSGADAPALKPPLPQKAPTESVINVTCASLPVVQVNAVGAGLLLGSALCIILPEGFQAAVVVGGHTNCLLGRGVGGCGVGVGWVGTQLGHS